MKFRKIKQVCDVYLKLPNIMRRIRTMIRVFRSKISGQGWNLLKWTVLRSMLSRNTSWVMKICVLVSFRTRTHYNLRFRDCDDRIHCFMTCANSAPLSSLTLVRPGEEVRRRWELPQSMRLIHGGSGWEMLNTRESRWMRRLVQCKNLCCCSSMLALYRLYISSSAFSSTCFFARSLLTCSLAPSSTSLVPFGSVLPLCPRRPFSQAD